MKLYIVFGLAYIVLVVAVILLAKGWIAEKKKSRELQSEVERQKKNVAYLVKHSETIAGIKAEKTKIGGSLKDAETDEDIADVVSRVIAANNSRVQDASKKQ